MQDEDVNVTDEFLIRLGNFMKGKGFDVPFEIPEDISKLNIKLSLHVPSKALDSAPST